MAILVSTFCAWLPEIMLLTLFPSGTEPPTQVPLVPFPVGRDTGCIQELMLSHLDFRNNSYSVPSESSFSLKLTLC